MKKLISILTLLALCLGCAGCGSPAEAESTVPTGEYLMIPVNPDTVYCDLPGYWPLPESAYLVRLEGDGEPIVIAVGGGQTNLGNVFQTSDGNQVVFYKEDGRYRFEKTTTKTKSCYSEDDELLWEMTITATFLYDGTGAECTDVSGEVYIAATGSWYVISETPEASGNTASYTVDFGRSALGVTTSSNSYTITVSCDAKGNLS